MHLCVNIIHRPVTKHAPEWRVTCTGYGMSTLTRVRELLRDTGHTWDWSRVSWHVSQVSSVNTVIVCREPRISQSDTGRDYYKQMILSDTAAIHSACKHQLKFQISYSLIVKPSPEVPKSKVPKSRPKGLAIKVAQNDHLDSPSQKNWPDGQQEQGHGVVLHVQEEVYQ